MHRRTLNPCARSFGLLALALWCAAALGCGDEDAQAEPSYSLAVPPQGAAATECRELVDSLCGMWVRCGELDESDFDDCVVQVDAQLECPLARLVTSAYPSCVSTLENECRSMDESLHPNCRGVVFF